MTQLPKITKIAGGEATLESDAISLSNYQTLGFLFENAEGAKLTVQIEASAEDGTAEAVPFVLQNTDTGEIENAPADGKEITDAGAFLAVITGDKLAHGGYDSAALSLSADTGTISGAFALQTNPRYSGDE